MGCPIVCCMAAASPGGIYSLVVQDRGGRGVTLSLLAAYLAAWAGYFAGVVPNGSEVGARITLEALFLPLWLAGYYRVRWLMRTQGVVPPFSRALGVVYRVGYALTSSPWIWATKGWLLCMLILQWAGRAHFSWGEYTVVLGVLMALISLRAISLLRRKATRTVETRSPLAMLEEVHAGQNGARGASSTPCPLGFGGGRCDGECGVAAPECRPEETRPMQPGIVTTLNGGEIPCI